MSSTTTIIPENPYPPNLTDPHLLHLITTITDYQFLHGSVLKIPPYTGQTFARPVGVSVFPSPFPRKLFEEAQNLQKVWNELYVKVSVAEKGGWLEGVLSR